jgi:hypothetical protein
MDRIVFLDLPVLGQVIPQQPWAGIIITPVLQRRRARYTASCLAQVHMTIKASEARSKHSPSVSKFTFIVSILHGHFPGFTYHLFPKTVRTVR